MLKSVAQCFYIDLFHMSLSQFTDMSVKIKRILLQKAILDDVAEQKRIVLLSCTAGIVSLRNYKRI